jgi:pSer/pThr/pTyr-binding forkhead associated (FHA) protein
MARVTLRILDGADRGSIFRDMATPVTVGREEGNTIQLNDDRVSRFHLKIQEDDDQLVLTDLQSTNGTRVNGEHTQLRILRPGDIILVGRSVLLVGSRDQIRHRLADLEPNGRDALPQPVHNVLEMEDSQWDPESVVWDQAEDLEATFGWTCPPEIPRGLRPGQAAKLAELLQYLHARIRPLLQEGKVTGRSEQVVVSQATWQKLIDVEARLASYLRQIFEPDEGEG